MQSVASIRRGFNRQIFILTPTLFARVFQALYYLSKRNCSGAERALAAIFNLPEFISDWSPTNLFVLGVVVHAAAVKHSLATSLQQALTRPGCAGLSRNSFTNAAVLCFHRKLWIKMATAGSSPLQSHLCPSPLYIMRCASRLTPRKYICTTLVFFIVFVCKLAAHNAFCLRFCFFLFNISNLAACIILPFI